MSRIHRRYSLYNDQTCTVYLQTLKRWSYLFLAVDNGDSWSLCSADNPLSIESRLLLLLFSKGSIRRAEESNRNILQTELQKMNGKYMD